MSIPSYCSEIRDKLSRYPPFRSTSTARSRLADTAANKMADYKGCEIYQYKDGYYGLPPGAGEFDVAKVEKKKYALMFYGDNLAEVIRHIDAAIQAGLIK